MKNRETGEFELVVGNGQIISGFFILALLLAVFFAMGFIVARAKYQQEPATTTAAASTPPELRQPASTPAQPPAEAKNEPPAQDSAPPAADSASPERPAETKAETKPEPAPADAAQGSYWQIIATKDPSGARALLQSMKDMGLPASLSPGPNETTRVLVGPYTDNATMAKVKTQLENAGLHPLKHTQ